MKAIERLYQYIDSKGIKPTRLEKEIGLSNGYLNTMMKRKADLGETIVNKIVDYCTDLNLKWLISGKGDMLKDNNSNLSDDLDSDSINCKLCAVKDKLIEQQEKTIEVLQEMIDMLKRKDNGNSHHEPIRQTG